MNPNIQITIGYLIIAIGVILGSVVGSIVVQSGREKKRQQQERIINVKPVVEFKIDLQKILTLENKGAVDIEDMCIFLTKYIFDENLFTQRKLKIKEYNKIGGVIKNIPLLKAKIGIEKVDLKRFPFITFYENPGREDNTPILTYYCLRIIFRKAITGQQYVHYIVTTSYKNFPSFIESQENIAIGGGDYADFMFDIPKIVKEHQRALYNDNAILTSFE